MHPLEVVARSLRFAARHVVADRLELEQELLEPELVDLVNRDEQQFVVSRWIGLPLLEVEEFGDLQVAPVREAAILFTEPRGLPLDGQSPFFPSPLRLVESSASASSALLAGAESSEFSATGVGSGADAYMGLSSPAITETMGVPTSTMS